MSHNIIPFLLTLLFTLAISACEYDSITLSTEYETAYSAPMTGPNGQYMGPGHPYQKAKYHFAVGGGAPQKIDFLASNLAPYLNPNSKAPKIIRGYAAKKTMSIVSLVGMLSFVLLQVTVGIEETGTTTTKPNMQGELETTKDRQITPLGTTFLVFAGVSGITALSLHLSSKPDLKKAVDAHNESLGSTVSLQLSIKF